MKLYLRRNIIGNPRDPLLIRYVIFETRWFKVCLHKLCRSDHDRALHDHPWDFFTMVLWRGYTEITLRGSFRRRPGFIGYRPATWTHRFVIDKPAWTLVVMSPRKRQWGFHTPTGWCWWRKYNYDLAICEDRVLHAGGGD